MRKKVSVLLVALFAFGFAFAGCGDDDNAGDSGSGSAPAATTDSSGSSTSSGAGGNDAAAQAAKDGCEAGIKANPAIDASKQDELSKECEKVGEAAASGDKDKFKAAYSSFCDKLAGALPEQARTAAKDACQQGANALG